MFTITHFTKYIFYEISSEYDSSFADILLLLHYILLIKTNL